MSSTSSPATAPPTTCAACPHPAAGHDAISRRYCAATVDASLTRGCICR